MVEVLDGRSFLLVAAVESAAVGYNTYRLASHKVRAYEELVFAVSQRSNVFAFVAHRHDGLAPLRCRVFHDLSKPHETPESIFLSTFFDNSEVFRLSFFRSVVVRDDLRFLDDDVYLQFLDVFVGVSI